MKPRPIVFLHIPKTAGQSVRLFLSNAFPKRLVFPGQTDHHLATMSRSDLERYDIFCGHFSWSLFDFLQDALVFSILRDPASRVVSFYHYLKRQGLALTPEQLQMPRHSGLRLAATSTLEQFLSTDDPATRGFLLGTLDNVYMYYFGTRVLNGRHLIRDVHPESDTFTTEKLLHNAIRNISDGLRIYDIANLRAMVADLSAEPGYAEQPVPTANRSADAPGHADRNVISENPARTGELLHLLCVYDMKIYQQFCL